MFSFRKVSITNQVEISENEQRQRNGRNVSFNDNKVNNVSCTAIEMSQLSAVWLVSYLLLCLSLRNV